MGEHHGQRRRTGPGAPGPREGCLGWRSGAGRETAVANARARASANSRAQGLSGGSPERLRRELEQKRAFNRSFNGIRASSLAAMGPPLPERVALGLSCSRKKGGWLLGRGGGRAAVVRPPHHRPVSPSIALGDHDQIRIEGSRRTDTHRLGQVMAHEPGRRWAASGSRAPGAGLALAFQLGGRPLASCFALLWQQFGGGFGAGGLDTSQFRRCQGQYRRRKLARLLRPCIWKRLTGSSLEVVPISGSGDRRDAVVCAGTGLARSARKSSHAHSCMFGKGEQALA